MPVSAFMSSFAISGRAHILLRIRRPAESQGVGEGRLVLLPGGAEVFTCYAVWPLPVGIDPSNRLIAAGERLNICAGSQLQIDHGQAIYYQHQR